MKRCVLLALSAAVILAQTSPVEFEVASIRASPRAQNGQGWDPLKIEATPGNLVMRNARLNEAIRWAYSMQPYQIIGPAWLTEVRFDIVAKATAQAPETEVRLMLQKLLVDRFKMAFHNETRELSVLFLNVNKNGHKLKPPSAEGEPGFRTGQMRLTGTGVTLEPMTAFLSGEMRTPVLDKTGLTGKYDYVLDIRSFVTEEMRRTMPRDGPPIEAPGIISGALQEQLGLRLDSSKAPIPVLVVDRMEREPSEN